MSIICWGLLFSSSLLSDSFCEVTNGYSYVNQDEQFIAKFLFQSPNGSYQMSLAYPESYSELKLRIYWDSPISWADGFNMRLPCTKKQEILQRLSSGQTISLDPSRNSWCQTLTLSSDILDYLEHKQDIGLDWSSSISAILLKISGASAASREWLNPLGIGYAEDKTADVTSQSRFSLPDVVQQAWLSFTRRKTEDEKKAMHNWVYCKSPLVPLRFTRPVWWFFTLENCEGTTHTKIPLVPENVALDGLISGFQSTYKIDLRNGGDLFHEHFSAEKFGSLEMDILFFLLLVVLLSVGVAVTYRLYRLQLLHPTALLWFTSIALHFIGQMTRMSVTIRLAVDGLYNQPAAVIAQLLSSLSTVSLFAALLLLSSGYTLIQRKITRTHGTVLIVVLSTYALAYTACQVAGEVTHHADDVWSRYHSPPIYVLISVQLLACVAFILNTAYTIFKWSEKRLLLMRVAIIYSFWFWYVPFWICITIEHAVKHYTEMIMRMWDEFVNITAYILMLWLLRPQSANAIFPFHLRQTRTTSQETILEPQQKSQACKPASSSIPTIKISETTKKSSPKPKELELTKPRKPPTKLPAIGGKPGDLAPPGFSITQSLTNLSADARWPKRPQTTSGVMTPRSQQEAKSSSAT